MTGLAMNWEDLDRIPMMQDSAYDIALTAHEVLNYSKSLLGEDYPSRSNDLKHSGYRKLNNGNFSLFANVGSIGPSYQPAHAHSDELSFELFYIRDSYHCGYRHINLREERYSSQRTIFN